MKSSSHNSSMMYKVGVSKYRYFAWPASVPRQAMLFYESLKLKTNPAADTTERYDPSLRDEDSTALWRNHDEPCLLNEMR